jgi:hypothetical protein
MIREQIIGYIKSPGFALDIQNKIKAVEMDYEQKNGFVGIDELKGVTFGKEIEYMIGTSFKKNLGFGIQIKDELKPYKRKEYRECTDLIINGDYELSIKSKNGRYDDPRIVVVTKRYNELLNRDLPQKELRRMVNNFSDNTCVKHDVLLVRYGKDKVDVYFFTLEKDDLVDTKITITDHIKKEYLTSRRIIENKLQDCVDDGRHVEILLDEFSCNPEAFRSYKSEKAELAFSGCREVLSEDLFE